MGTWGPTRLALAQGLVGRQIARAYQNLQLGYAFPRRCTSSAKGMSQMGHAGRRHNVRGQYN